MLALGGVLLARRSRWLGDRDAWRQTVWRPGHGLGTGARGDARTAVASVHDTATCEPAIVPAPQHVIAQRGATLLTHPLTDDATLGTERVSVYGEICAQTDVHEHACENLRASVSLDALVRGGGGGCEDPRRAQVPVAIDGVRPESVTAEAPVFGAGAEVAELSDLGMDGMSRVDTPLPPARCAVPAQVEAVTVERVESAGRCADNLGSAGGGGDAGGTRRASLRLGMLNPLFDGGVDLGMLARASADAGSTTPARWAASSPRETGPPVSISTTPACLRLERAPSQHVLDLGDGDHDEGGGGEAALTAGGRPRGEATLRSRKPRNKTRTCVLM